MAPVGVATGTKEVNVKECERRAKIERRGREREKSTNERETIGRGGLSRLRGFPS